MNKLLIFVCFAFYMFFHIQNSTAVSFENTAKSEPQYTEDGQLLRPDDYQTWVFVGASIGMSYSEEVRREGPGTFGNVYIEPEAYRHYLRTGEFQEKSMFVLVNYEPGTDESINRHGYFEGKMTGLSVALKDHATFEEGWAYFSFSNGDGPLKRTAKAFPKEECYSCHLKHAADDNVFVQFYPILRGSTTPGH